MILNVSKISKTFIDKAIIEDISFHIEDKEKVAIVGNNGAGKTTLLKIITGQLEQSSGTVTVSSAKSILHHISQ